MNKHAAIVWHLPVEEVQKQYRACRDARVKSRWRAIWLRMRGKTTTEVSEMIDCKPDWIRRLVRRWNKDGTAGLNEGRKKNGRRPLLSTEQQADLHEALMHPAPDGGLWNQRKVADWISERVGYKVPHKRGWIYMRSLGFTSQTPRPRHREADKLQQEEFKKNFPNSIPILGVFVRKPRSKFGPKTRRAWD